MICRWISSLNQSVAELEGMPSLTRIWATEWGMQKWSSARMTPSLTNWRGLSTALTSISLILCHKSAYLDIIWFSLSSIKRRSTAKFVRSQTWCSNLASHFLRRVPTRLVPCIKSEPNHAECVALQSLFHIWEHGSVSGERTSSLLLWFDCQDMVIPICCLCTNIDSTRVWHLLLTHTPFNTNLHEKAQAKSSIWVPLYHA